MNFKNARTNKDGSFECEVLHPKYGWIPFTASEHDSSAEGRDLHAAISTSGLAAEYGGESKALDEQREQELQRQLAQLERDSALQALTYDFGDGRVIQTRPQDEANMIRAIQVMEEEEGVESIGWVMADNVKHPVTLEELRAALRAGRLAGLAIWDDYDPGLANPG